MRKTTRMLAVVLVISFALTFAACGTSNSKLQGKWISLSGPGAPYAFPKRMEFYSDGTLAVGSHSGTYSIVDGITRFGGPD
jgi:hypothetical protein